MQLIGDREPNDSRGRWRLVSVTAVGALLCLLVVATLGMGPATATDSTDSAVTAVDSVETNASASAEASLQEEPWVNVVVTDAQGSQGDQVTVTVEVEELVEDRGEGEEEALGYNLLFSYDTDVVEFVEATPVAFNSTQVHQDPPTGTGFDPEVSGEYGVLRVADLEPDSTSPVPFTAVELTFELVGEPGDETAIEMVPETDDGVELGGVGTNPTDGWPATFEAGTVQIREEQAPVGTVSGTVTDEAGDPVEGATVSVAGTQATTDSDGTYEIELEEGTYDLQVSADGHQQGTAEIQIEQESTTTRDIELAGEEMDDEESDGSETSDDGTDEDESAGGMLTTVGQVLGLLSLGAAGALLLVAVVGRFTDRV